jgi:hypothetical protein
MWRVEGEVAGDEREAGVLLISLHPASDSFLSASYVTSYSVNHSSSCSVHHSLKLFIPPW